MPLGKPSLAMIETIWTWNGGFPSVGGGTRAINPTLVDLIHCTGLQSRPWTLPSEHWRLVCVLRVSWPATDPVGILDLLPRLQAPASMHLCLQSFEGASPSQLSPLVIGAMPNLVTRPQDRGRLVSWRPFTGGETKDQKGEPTTQDHLDSDRGAGLVPGRSLS